MFHVYIAECAIAFHQAYSQHCVDINNLESQNDRFAVLHMWPQEVNEAQEEVAITPVMVEAMYFTETYTRRLLSWLKLIRWPVSRDTKDPGVTFLELFSSFRFVTGSLPPINCAPAAWGTPHYLLAEKQNPDPAIRMKPQPMHQAIRVFEFSLRYINKLLGQSVVPLKWLGQSTCLSHLGIKGARGGFLVRPQFPGCEVILPKIAEASSKSRGKFFSVDFLDNTHPENPQIQIDMCDSDLGRNPWKSYGRFKQIKKNCD